MFPPPVRNLEPGIHSFLAILPGAMDSPAMQIIGTDRYPASEVIGGAKVRLVPEHGFCWVDETVPCIDLTIGYYETGNDLDLYLDLLHELTHIRQLLEGRDLWDENYPYHRRPTEIEGFAVAVSECRRLGLDENTTLEHLTNPWMTPPQVAELLAAIKTFLTKLTEDHLIVS